MREDWLAGVADAAARDAGAPADLLGEYLRLLADAATSGGRPGRDDLALVSTHGRDAARRAIPPGQAVNLYLSAAWRLWRELPAVVRSSDSEVVRGAADAVLQVAADAVAVFVDGYQDERRESIRREESLRREFIDDLLRGDADVAALVERAEPFGLDLTRAHQVVLATGPQKSGGLDLAAAALERAVVARFGDRDVLVATKESFLVVLVPAPGDGAGGADVGATVHAELRRGRNREAWRVGVGRPYAGAYGIARSYEEAREALELSARLGVNERVVQARDVLVYRVLARDQAAIIDLVRAVLTPLQAARGGAEPLLDTLQAYFAAGGVATLTARQLHLSVRAVTYRLARIRELTGYDVDVPEQAFAVQAAVLGARLLGWPVKELPA
ncbi:MAG TPA: helix-turn-helix domain-containing protein [Mycobacteriales bacterium]|nr:helix-turn-helix domain-containing protein [Mycobacteriales bacterium]